MHEDPTRPVALDPPSDRLPPEPLRGGPRRRRAVAALSRHFPAGALLALALLATLAHCALGCSGISPATVSAIEHAAVELCPLEALIPVAGPVLASACPGEEAALAAALAAVTANAPPPSAARVSLPGPTPALDAGPVELVAVYRRGGDGGLVHVGQVDARIADACQQALLTADARAR